jgi:hypothetical protein
VVVGPVPPCSAVDSADVCTYYLPGTEIRTDSDPNRALLQIVLLGTVAANEPGLP